MDLSPRDQDQRHVYRVNEEHNTEGLDCWCLPTYNRVCNECGMRPLAEKLDNLGIARLHAEPEQMKVNDEQVGCWKCTNGLIPLTRDEAGQEEEPMIIVHNSPYAER